MLLVLVIGVCCAATASGGAAGSHETSFWVHASLPDSWGRGYWDTSPPAPPAHPATIQQVAAAAKLLTGNYSANTLYLLYHDEVSWGVAQPLFRAWHAAAAPGVELVPTLLFRSYNASEGIDPFGGHLNFGAATSNTTLDSMMSVFAEINPHRLGVFDVYPNRDQGIGPALAERHGLLLTRVGLQPAEKLPALYRGGGVEDTWSAVCCGRTNELWSELSCGRSLVKQWAADRMADPRPFAFDLIVVAWDYNMTANGTNPNIDDAAKNQALPAGRTKLVVDAIRSEAMAAGRGGAGGRVGFSSDLTILEADGRVPQRDGRNRSIYATLRAGVLYWGTDGGSYYGRAFREITQIYSELHNEVAP